MWYPNRRFMRDMRQLQQRGHSITCLRGSDAELVFWIDGTSCRFDGIHEAARQYREHPKWTAADLRKARDKAAEVVGGLQFWRGNEAVET